MPHLRKTEQNAHGNYAYVSIDDFYEKAAKVVTANGLTWHINEISAQVIELQGRSGVTNAMVTNYEVGLIHKSGEHWPAFFKATITHPLQGAQTAGSSMSYLDKLFLRTTFSIVTGEKDADATDNSVFDLGPADAGRGQARTKSAAKPKGQGAEPDAFDLTDSKPAASAARPVDVSSAADTAAFAALSTEFISLASNEAELTEYWTSNETTFNLLKTADSEAYKALIDGFKKRKAQLKGAEA